MQGGWVQFYFEIPPEPEPEPEPEPQPEPEPEPEPEFDSPYSSLTSYSQLGNNYSVLKLDTTNWLYNFDISEPIVADILVVGGGGSGGSYNATDQIGGGGGGAGSAIVAYNVVLTPGNYSAYVGTGGQANNNGGNSAFFSKYNDDFICVPLVA